MSRPIESFLAKLQNAKRSGKGWSARCPNHDDKKSSLSISEGKDGRVLLKCHAGCTTEEIVKVVGLEMKHMFVETTNSKAASQHAITVASLAKDKGLPSSFLQSLGVIQENGCVRITYYLEDKTPATRQRKRTALKAKEGSFWEPGEGSPVPYGLWRLEEARKIGYLSLVEGESDSWTLWYHGYPALGIPGAEMTSKLEAKYLSGISRVYVVQEHDQGGAAFTKGIATRLKELGWSGNAFVIPMAGTQDPNDIHKQSHDDFKSTFQAMIEKARPLPGFQNKRLVKPAFQPTIKSAKSLLEKVFPAIKWAVKDILPEGTMIFAGKPKMGKSALALNIAVAIACGSTALGKINVEKGDVLYLALEDGERRLRDRIKQMLNGTECPERLEYATEWQNFADGGLEAIEAWLKAHLEARLVIIDTLAKVRPPQRSGESIYDRDYNSVQGLKKLADTYRVTILIVHHARKAEATDALETISGSFGLSGGVDGALVLKRERGKADAILSITGRDVEEKEFALRFKFPCWELMGDAEEFRVSQERQSIIAILKENRKPMSPKEVLDALEEKGAEHTINSVKLLLSRMSRNGEIRCIERGKYFLADIQTPQTPQTPLL